MKNYSVKKQIRSIILIILCILTVCSCQKESGTNVLSSSSVPDTPEISTEYVSPLPENKPTDPLALTFCDTELNSEFLFPFPKRPFYLPSGYRCGTIRLNFCPS